MLNQPSNDSGASGPPLRIGLVGAGPWAQRTHAPALANSGHATLAGVWARRPEAAADLAGRYGAPAFADIDDLFDASDAVAFAVPPDIQVELGIRAARSGRPLLLEKPLGPDLEGARRLAAAVAEAGVVTQLGLVLRYADEVRHFLDQAGRLQPFGGHGVWISSAHTLAGPRSPWRIAGGPLLDVGPHVLDLLEAALGPIERVRAHGRPTGWTGLLCDHADGAVSEVSLCVPLEGSRPERRIQVVGNDGSAQVDLSALTPGAWDNLLAGFVAAVGSGNPSAFDAAHGLHLQTLLAQAQYQLARDGAQP